MNECVIHGAVSERGPAKGLLKVVYLRIHNSISHVVFENVFNWYSKSTSAHTHTDTWTCLIKQFLLDILKTLCQTVPYKTSLTNSRQQMTSDLKDYKEGGSNSLMQHIVWDSGYMQV